MESLGIGLLNLNRLSIGLVRTSPALYGATEIVRFRLDLHISSSNLLFNSWGWEISVSVSHASPTQIPYGGANLANRSLVVETISAQYSIDDHAGLAFVYYKHQNRECQMFKDIVPALVKQLCQKKHVLPKEVKELYHQYSRQDQFPSQAKIQAHLVEVAESFERVYIVIDALDECPDPDMVFSLIAALAQCVSAKIKIFVTSRREQFILHSFRKLHSPTLEIEAKKVDKDIMVFVDAEIDHRSKDYEYGTIDQVLKAQIREALVAQANGM